MKTCEKTSKGLLLTLVTLVTVHVTFGQNVYMFICLYGYVAYAEVIFLFVIWSVQTQILLFMRGESLG